MNIDGVDMRSIPKRSIDYHVFTHGYSFDACRVSFYQLPVKCLS